jgi:ABC-type lipoprotein export system ATPase subunit
MLKRMVIENYRSCLKTTIDFHPNLSVLIGPNGSGKTNILQAILFLSKLAQEPRFVPSRSDATTVSSRIKASFQEKRTQVQLNASVNADTDESNNDVILASRQKWLIKLHNRKAFPIEIPLALAARAESGWMFHQYTLHYAQAYGIRPIPRPGDTPRPISQVLARVAGYCKGISYYGASQFTNPGLCPASFQIEQEGPRRRLLRLRGHERTLYSMYSTWKAGSNQRYGQFIDVVGRTGLRLIDDLTFREVQTSAIDYFVQVGGRVKKRRRNKLLVVPQFRIGRQTLSPNQLSEGTFKTLALLFYVITEDSTALLIEEPEVCVHHGLLSSILELIKSSSDRKQVVISTHSDYVLDHVKPENVYQVTFESPHGTAVRHIRNTMTKKEFSALREYLEREGNLGEYWREGGLGDRP